MVRRRLPHRPIPSLPNQLVDPHPRHPQPPRPLPHRPGRRDNHPCQRLPNGSIIRSLRHLNLIRHSTFVISQSPSPPPPSPPLSAPSSAPAYAPPQSPPAWPRSPTPAPATPPPPYLPALPPADKPPSLSSIIPATLTISIPLTPHLAPPRAATTTPSAFSSTYNVMPPSYIPPDNNRHSQIISS